MKEDATQPRPHTSFTDDLYQAALEILEAEHFDPTMMVDILAHVHPADIADFLEKLPRKHREEVAKVLPSEVLGEVLAELEEGAQEHILSVLEREDVRDAVAELESDDAVDIVQHLEETEPDTEPTKAKTVLADKQQKRLLEYDPDTAGGLMQLEVVTALPTQKVSDVFKYMRQNSDALPSNPGTVFVLNERRKLLGTLSITRLIQCPLTRPLADVMRPDPFSVTPDTPKAEVIQIFEKYNIHNLAVVNKRGALLGRVTIDDILDAMMSEYERQRSRAAGLNEGEDLFAPVLHTTSQRLPWLIINLFTAVLASLVIALFQNDIQQLVALAVLMPIVASMGGNAATQTMTVAVRGLSAGHITWKNALHLLGKEITVGGLNGIFLGALLALGTYVFYQNAMLALVIALATVVNHFLAALAGHLVPIILKKTKYDPAISSGVLVTTVTDVGGFFVFLGLAAILLL